MIRYDPRELYGGQSDASIFIQWLTAQRVSVSDLSSVVYHFAFPVVLEDIICSVVSTDPLSKNVLSD